MEDVIPVQVDVRIGALGAIVTPGIYNEAIVCMNISIGVLGGIAQADRSLERLTSLCPQRDSQIPCPTLDCAGNYGDCDGHAGGCTGDAVAGRSSSGG